MRDWSKDMVRQPHLLQLQRQSQTTLVYVPLGLARYNPKRFFIATLTGKLVLSYVIVFISHYLGLSLVEPFLADVSDATPVYIGIIVFGAAMTTVVVLMLRLDWARVLGRFVPWTLDEGDGDDNTQNKN